MDYTLARSSLAFITVALFPIAEARAQTAEELCRRVPRQVAEQALGATIVGADVLDDRIGPYRRIFCRWHGEKGDVLEAIEWTRRDGQPVGVAPVRAEQCDTTCIQA